MHTAHSRHQSPQSGNLLVSLLVMILFLAGALWILTNRQLLLDRWHIATFKPSAAILQLAHDDTMVSQGYDLYMASQPIIDGRDAFNRHCTVASEQTIVLGCYANQQIYLYDVTDPRFSGVEQVTAAHEMLHAAYDRLSTSERTRVNDLLNAELAKHIDDQHLNELMTLYKQSEPGQMLNEMHSVLGTEYAHLSPDLEQYYKSYFANRAKIVAYATAYESVFTESKNKIAAMDKQLDAWKAQIDSNNQELSIQQASLRTQLNQMNALAASGNTAAYNQQVPGYNQKVTTFNDLVQQTKTLVTQYNQLVVTRNQQATAQNGLYQSLDSHYQPVGQ